MKTKLIGFNRYIIYKLYIETKFKVIRIKNLQILDYIDIKTYSALPNFNKKSTFDGIQLLNIEENVLSPKSATFKKEIKIKEQV